MKKESIFSKYKKEYETYRDLYTTATSDTARLALTAARRLTLAHQSEAKPSTVAREQFAQVLSRIENMAKRHCESYMKSVYEIRDIAHQGFKAVGLKKDDEVYDVYKLLMKKARSEMKKREHK